MLALDESTTLELSTTTLLRSLSGQKQFFAFDVVSGEQFRLNRSAYWILEAIGSGIEWTKLRTQFLDTFDVAPEDGEADLRITVNQFLEEKLIRRVCNGKESQGKV